MRYEEGIDLLQLHGPDRGDITSFPFAIAYEAYTNDKNEKRAKLVSHITI